MKKNILIADDDPAILDSLQMILELEGYEVSSMIDAKKIYEIKDYPDLLLLDIWMSGYDGREVCKDLKSNPATSDIPIIMISASKDVKKSAKNAGADDFITKPFEMGELIKKVKKYTKN